MNLVPPMPLLPWPSGLTQQAAHTLANGHAGLRQREWKKCFQHKSSKRSCLDGFLRGSVSVNERIGLSHGSFAKLAIKRADASRHATRCAFLLSNMLRRKSSLFATLRCTRITSASMLFNRASISFVERVR
eukprot:1454399-Rhodomonas_salina.2